MDTVLITAVWVAIGLLIFCTYRWCSKFLKEKEYISSERLLQPNDGEKIVWHMNDGEGGFVETQFISMMEDGSVRVSGNAMVRKDLPLCCDGYVFIIRMGDNSFEVNTGDEEIRVRINHFTPSFKCSLLNSPILKTRIKDMVPGETGYTVKYPNKWDVVQEYSDEKYSVLIQKGFYDSFEIIKTDCMSAWSNPPPSLEDIRAYEDKYRDDPEIVEFSKRDL